MPSSMGRSVCSAILQCASWGVGGCEEGAPLGTNAHHLLSPPCDQHPQAMALTVDS